MEQITRAKWMITILVLGGLSCGILQPVGTDETGLTIHFFDVGQGLSVLVQDNQNYELLYDTGPSRSDTALLHVVDSLNIDTLETVVISHPDEDHFGGMFALCAQVPVSRVVWKNFFPYRENNKRIYFFCDSLNIPQEIIARGDTLAGLNQCLVECLWPQTEPLLVNRDSTNQNSVVLKLTANRVSCLLAGDISAAAESILVASSGEQVRVQLLSASHHGSKNSNCLTWLAATRPLEVVVSCGADNPYGHPAPEALNRFKAIGCTVRRTDQEGTITYQTNGWEWCK